MAGNMERDETVQLEEFTFGECTLKVMCRKTLAQTINFRLTVQCETEDLFESLRGFGGGMPESEPSSPIANAAADTDTNQDAQPGDEKPDLLGLDVWPASLELCTYLAANPSLVAGATVLELGAGVGLPALLSAQLGAQVAVLTDYEQRVVDHVAHNAKLCGVMDRCSGLRLDWTKLDELPSRHHAAYSVLLAADVLYQQDLMPGFVQSMLTLLAPGGIVIVGHQTRRSLVLDETGTPEMLQEDVSFKKFQELCAETGLHMRMLGSRESPNFPGPLLMLALALDSAQIVDLPPAFVVVAEQQVGTSEADEGTL